MFQTQPQGSDSQEGIPCNPLRECFLKFKFLDHRGQAGGLEQDNDAPLASVFRSMQRSGVTPDGAIERLAQM